MLCYIVSCKYMAINTFNGIIIHFVDKSTDCDIM